MNKILQHITMLRKERNWTEYHLADRAGLTQSTISTWYRRDIIPTIPSIEKVCDAFGITLSQFFLESSDHTVTLSDKQLELIQNSARLNSKQLDKLIELLDTL